MIYSLLSIPFILDQVQIVTQLEHLFCQEQQGNAGLYQIYMMKKATLVRTF